MEPLQNTGGAFAPPEGYWARIREICDRYGVLLVSDEVICAFGRLGHMFGSDRYGYQPDLITFAKGVTSGYAPLGGRAGVRSHRRTVPRRPEPVPARPDVRRPSGLLRGGQRQPRHPRARGSVRQRAGATKTASPSCSTACATSRSSATCAATATSGPSSWSAIRPRRERSRRRSRSGCCAGYLSPRLYEAGLICRADDRAEPVITLAPPLIAGEAELAFIVDTLRTVLSDAATEFAARQG